MIDVNMMHKVVYILESEIELHSLIAIACKNIGVKAKHFSNAEDLFSQVNFFEKGSMLICDLHLQETDGVEVMRKLAKFSNAPVLILTSDLDKSVLHSAEKLGVIHGLNIVTTMLKPLKLAKLQQCIQEYAPNKYTHEIPSNLTVEIDVSELEEAILNNKLTLYYQPQYSIKSKCIIGLEALVRWEHPIMGLISANEFVHIAETNGLMPKLTHWVIERAVRQEQEWESHGIEVPISVNISASDINSLYFPDQLSALLLDTKLNPKKLIIEITESAMMGDPNITLDILTRLRLKGFKLSIDDFGTGYSSFELLHKMPFTELKIDRLFVSTMEIDEEARAIVNTCILLGHALKMDVVAEGVECEDHHSILKSLGCDKFQGFWLSKPMSVEYVTRKLLVDRALRESSSLLELKKA